MRTVIEAGEPGRRARDGRAASRRPARAARRPPSQSDLRGTGHTRKAVTLGERAHRGRLDLLAGTAVGRGKRVRRRTEPGARCCYGDVEEEEEPRWGGVTLDPRAVNRGGEGVRGFRGVGS
jgi:hypothetical protein